MREQRGGSCSAGGPSKSQGGRLTAIQIQEERGQRRPGRRQGRLQNVQHGGEVLQKYLRSLKADNEIKTNTAGDVCVDTEQRLRRPLHLLVTSCNCCLFNVFTVYGFRRRSEASALVSVSDGLDSDVFTVITSSQRTCVHVL